MREKYCFILVFTIAILLAISLLTTSIISIKPRDLGLASYLPATFWVGLSLLGVLWFVGRNSKHYLIAGLLLTFAYLFIAPVLIKKPVWLSNSYYPYAESLLINSNGHLEPRKLDILTSYHYWPVFLFLASPFTLITSMPTEPILKLFPLISVGLYTLLTYLILRVKFEFKYAILGSAFFLCSFFSRQQYFGPPGIAYIYYLIAFLLSTWIFFSGKKNKNIFLILFFVISILLIFTHILTSFLLIISLISIYCAYMFINKKSHYILGISILGLITIFSIHNIYIVPNFGLLRLMIVNIFEGLESFSFFNESNRIIGTFANELNYYSSWAIVIINLIGFGITTINNLRKKSNKESYTIYLAIFIITLGIFGIIGRYGAHEAYQRAFMFGLVPLAYLSVNVMQKRVYLLNILIISLAFLNIPAQYGSDTFRLANEKQLSGSRFFAYNTPNQITVHGQFSLYIRYYDPVQHITFKNIPGTSLPFTFIPNNTDIFNAINSTDYTILSNLTYNFVTYYYGKNLYDNIKLDLLNKIYDNSGYIIIRPIIKN